MEKLIQLTNSEDFKQDWSLFITGISSKAREDHTILSLEAYYSGFETDREGEKLSWKIACDGLGISHFNLGYLGPSCKIKILSDHPILWGSISETYFYIHSPCKNIASLLGDLLIVHTDTCGNWIDFARIFGFLPKLLDSQSKFQLAAPTPLIEHYFKVFERHSVAYTLNTTQKYENDLSVLLFSNEYYPDNYNHGRPYITARKFEIMESIGSMWQ
jgi:hypothetical protein